MRVSRSPEPLELYRRMSRARAFEEVVAELWEKGAISGEMHLGTGEEAVAAGVTIHLGEEDSVCLDHRPDPVLTMLDVPLSPLLAEMLGKPNGISAGRAGHMHLMSREKRATSSGIVGSSAPLATGFALAAKRFRKGGVAVSFFGDGAANQGMVLEAWNLAVVWKLPVLFVCKDNGWAITTRSESVTGGSLLHRAEAMGLSTRKVDGIDAVAVQKEAGRLLARIRAGNGPALLLASCSRLDGHFLGDLLVRSAEHPLSVGRATLKSVIAASLSRGGAKASARARGVSHMIGVMRQARGQRRGGKNDPLVRARKNWRRHRRAFEMLDREARAEVKEALAKAEGDRP